MKALIDQPPFVEALQSLVDYSKAAPEALRGKTIEQIQTALESGQCEAAMLWMTPPGDKVRRELPPEATIRFASIPGRQSVSVF